MSTQITFRIHSVKCVDETGGSFAEKFGNDEIFLSGFGIDASGATVKVPAFEVYAHFDDGDVKNYATPKRFVTLNLGNTPGAKDATAGFLLCEKDGGGIGTALNKLYAKVEEELAKKREEERRRRGGSLLGIDWGTVWKAVGPTVYEYVKTKIISGLDDDVFPLQSVTVEVPASGTWNGSKTSPRGTVEFRGHDGVYRMTYDWELA